jgi:hypothetical protein
MMSKKIEFILVIAYKYPKICIIQSYLYLMITTDIVSEKHSKSGL